MHISKHTICQNAREPYLWWFLDAVFNPNGWQQLPIITYQYTITLYLPRFSLDMVNYWNSHLKTQLEESTLQPSTTRLHDINTTENTPHFSNLQKLMSTIWHQRTLISQSMPTTDHVSAHISAMNTRYVLDDLWCNLRKIMLTIWQCNELIAQLFSISYDKQIRRLDVRML
jgi:hypothetical protein